MAQITGDITPFSGPCRMTPTSIPGARILICFKPLPQERYMSFKLRHAGEVISLLRVMLVTARGNNSKVVPSTKTSSTRFCHPFFS